MDDSCAQEPELILVLCHSFFYDAFRLPDTVTTDVFKNWSHSHFIANVIIEKQSELPEGSSFGVTSQQVFDNFAYKFQGDNPSERQKETVNILRNSIDIIDHPSVNKLALDESVFVICDTLYSRSNLEPILVSDIPKKIEKAEAFYTKKDPDAKVPFQIYTVAETELILRGRYPKICKSVDNRTKIKIYPKK